MEGVQHSPGENTVLKRRPDRHKKRHSGSELRAQPPLESRPTSGGVLAIINRARFPRGAEAGSKKFPQREAGQSSARFAQIELSGNSVADTGS